MPYLSGVLKIRWTGNVKIDKVRKSFAIDPSTDYIISLAPKAKKVGGLFLALAGAAVCPDFVVASPSSRARTHEGYFL